MAKKIDSKFKTFNPRDYLREYYSRIGNENYSLLKFFYDAYKHIPRNSTILEFGGGPTIYSIIGATTKAKEIHFSDFLEKNLAEVKLWHKKSRDAFDWSLFFKSALQIEGLKKVEQKDIRNKENLLRKKLTKFFICDAFQTMPLGKKYSKFYDVVNVNFVLDSITSSRKIWEDLLTNIVTLLKTDGVLIMSALKNAAYWRTLNKFYPAVSINENEIKKIFNKLGLKIISITSIQAEVTNKDSDKYEGYQGMIFVSAKKT